MNANTEVEQTIKKKVQDNKTRLKEAADKIIIDGA